MVKFVHSKNASVAIVFNDKQFLKSTTSIAEQYEKHPWYINFKLVASQKSIFFNVVRLKNDLNPVLKRFLGILKDSREVFVKTAVSKYVRLSGNITWRKFIVELKIFDFTSVNLVQFVKSIDCKFGNSANAKPEINWRELGDKNTKFVTVSFQFFGEIPF